MQAFSYHILSTHLYSFDMYKRNFDRVEKYVFGGKMKLILHSDQQGREAFPQLLMVPRLFYKYCKFLLIIEL